MIRHSVLAFFLTAAAPPSALTQDNHAADHGALAATFPALEAFLATQQTAQHLPSLAVGVVADGTLVYQKGFGVRDRDGKQPVDADTIYRIGSVTKTFTSLAILKLRDDGKLSLDDPATRFLPELQAVKYPTANHPPITIRQLLTHTSGLPRLGAFDYAQADHDVSEAELLGALPGTTLLFLPGTQTLYSNFGFGLLGLVVKRAAGVPYRDYVSANIFAPLGMTHSRWRQTDVPADRLATAYESGPNGPRPVAHWRMGASEAAGGIYSSVRDLGRYLGLQLAAYQPRDGGNDDGHAAVRASSLREAHVIFADGVGLAWHVQPSCAYGPIVWHNGGMEGYASDVALLPQRGVAVVVLANLGGGAELSALLAGALHILADKPTSAPPSTRSVTVAEQLAALTGGWNESTYATLLAPAIPRPAMQTFFKNLGDAHGVCRVGPAISSDGQNQATLTLLCQRGGDLTLDLTMAADGRRVNHFWIRPPLAWLGREHCPAQ